MGAKRPSMVSIMTMTLESFVQAAAMSGMWVSKAFSKILSSAALTVWSCAVLAAVAA